MKRGFFNQPIDKNKGRESDNSDITSKTSNELGKLSIGEQHIAFAGGDPKKYREQHEMQRHYTTEYYNQDLLSQETIEFHKLTEDAKKDEVFKANLVLLGERCMNGAESRYTKLGNQKHLYQDISNKIRMLSRDDLDYLHLDMIQELVDIRSIRASIADQIKENFTINSLRNDKEMNELINALSGIYKIPPEYKLQYFNKSHFLYTIFKQEISKALEGAKRALKTKKFDYPTHWEQLQQNLVPQMWLEQRLSRPYEISTILDSIPKEIVVNSLVSTSLVHHSKLNPARMRKNTDWINIGYKEFLEGTSNSPHLSSDERSEINRQDIIHTSYHLGRMIKNSEFSHLCRAYTNYFLDHLRQHNPHSLRKIASDADEALKLGMSEPYNPSERLAHRKKELKDLQNNIMRGSENKITLESKLISQLYWASTNQIERYTRIIAEFSKQNKITDNIATQIKNIDNKRQELDLILKEAEQEYKTEVDKQNQIQRFAKVLIPPSEVNYGSYQRISLDALQDMLDRSIEGSTDTQDTQDLPWASKNLDNTTN